MGDTKLLYGKKSRIYNWKETDTLINLGKPNDLHTNEIRIFDLARGGRTTASYVVALPLIICINYDTKLLYASIIKFNIPPNKLIEKHSIEFIINQTMHIYTLLIALENLTYFPYSNTFYRKKLTYLNTKENHFIYHIIVYAL